MKITQVLNNMGDNSSLSFSDDPVMTGNAVEVRGAFKSFNNGVPVLNDFSMTVESGTM
jgi:hypothetical protein